MTKRRERRSPPPGEFEDPLENYSSPEFEDPFEQSVCTDGVTVMRNEPVCQVTADTPVRRAVELMVENNIGGVVITEDGKVVGIFSERDVLNRVADDFKTMENKPVREVMTEDPSVVYRTDTPARAMNLMATGGFRHVPVVDADHKLVGILGPRRVIDYFQQHFPEISSG